VLQCVAVCYRVLQYGAVYYSMLPCAAVCYRVQPCVAVRCTVLPRSFALCPGANLPGVHFPMLLGFLFFFLSLLEIALDSAIFRATGSNEVRGGGKLVRVEWFCRNEERGVADFVCVEWFCGNERSRACAFSNFCERSCDMAQYTRTHTHTHTHTYIYVYIYIDVCTYA